MDVTCVFNMYTEYHCRAENIKKAVNHKEESALQNIIMAQERAHLGRRAGACHSRGARHCWPSSWLQEEFR